MVLLKLPSPDDEPYIDGFFFNEWINEPKEIQETIETIETIEDIYEPDINDLIQEISLGRKRVSFKYKKPLYRCSRCLKKKKYCKRINGEACHSCVNYCNQRHISNLDKDRILEECIQSGMNE